MLYTSNDLNSPKWKESIVPLQRYLHKYHMNEINKLKHHEKDFLFRSMLHLRNATDNQSSFNIYKIPEAKEFLFNKIILTYSEGVVNFNGVFYDYNGKITPNNLRKDKRFFHEYLSIWENQLKAGKGAYLSVLKPMFLSKVKEINALGIEGTLTKAECENRIKYLKAVFFFIYYKVKYFFDEKTLTYIQRNILGYEFIANIYTFCHILSRHYIPSLNDIFGVSLNDGNQLIDIQKMPESIMEIVNSYFTAKGTLDKRTEYILIEIDNEPYIIWLKYKKLNELKQKEGFEIRTFYKPLAKEILEKFKGKIKVKYSEQLAFLF